MTKKNRKEVYLEIARRFAEGEECFFGMCYSLRELSRRGKNRYHPQFIKLYTEFILHYPKNQTADDYWDVTDDDRVIIMCMCAAMCE